MEIVEFKSKINGQPVLRDKATGKLVKGSAPTSPGRPKGSKNKSNRYIRKFLGYAYKKFMQEKLHYDLEQMRPVDRWRTLEALQKYFMPTMAQVDVESKVKTDLNITVNYKKPIDKQDNQKQLND